MAKKQNESGGKNWLPITIAILSLALSGMALWVSALAPADIRVSISSLVFQWQGIGPTPQPEFPGTRTTNRVLAMKATCAFANNGAQIGAINDLAVIFQSDDGTKWLFSPYSVISERDIPFTQSLSKEPFHSIVVPGKQTSVYSYMFIAELASTSSEDIVLAPHKFHVMLSSWSAENLQPRKQQESTLDLNSNVIKAISTGEPVTVPFEEDRQRLQMFLK